MLAGAVWSVRRGLLPSIKISSCRPDGLPFSLVCILHGVGDIYKRLLIYRVEALRHSVVMLAAHCLHRPRPSPKAAKPAKLRVLYPGTDTQPRFDPGKWPRKAGI
jgi:hypothetical protein